MPRSLFTPFAAALFATTAPTQTFVVDAQNGPGTNFTTIAAAVTAVPDGATLLVRPGIYTGFSVVQKGVNVLADPGVHVYSGITILEVGPQQKVVIRGVEWGNPTGVGTLAVRDCRGPVLVEDCAGTPANAPFGGTISIQASDSVHLARTLVVSPLFEPVELSGSDVTITDSQLRGPIGRTGLQQIGGRTRISNTYVEGAGSVLPASPTSVVGMLGGELTLDGDSALVGAAPVMVGIEGNGNAIVDPGATILSTNRIGAGITEFPRALARCSASTAALGGTATATIEGPSGSFAVALAGFVGAAQNVPGPMYPLWIDLGTMIPVVSGVTPLTSSYTVPNAAWVRGITFGWQGLVYDQTNGLQLSNPGIYTHW